MPQAPTFSMGHPISALGSTAQHLQAAPGKPWYESTCLFTGPNPMSMSSLLSCSHLWTLKLLGAWRKHLKAFVNFGTKPAVLKEKRGSLF